MRNFLELDLQNCEIHEYRQYEKYSDDTRGRGGDCRFDIWPGGVRMYAHGYSGMADACPESRKQELWLIENTRHMGAKQTAPLYWSIPGYENILDLNKKLLADGAKLKELYYVTDSNSLPYLLGELFKYGYFVKIIWIEDNKWSREDSIILPRDLFTEIGEYCSRQANAATLSIIAEMFKKNPDNIKSIDALLKYSKIQIVFRDNDDRCNPLSQ